MSSLKEHAADEAGGEIILSSEGMDPLPSVRPPTIITSTSTGPDELDTFSVVSIENVLNSFVHSKLQRNLESPREKLERLSRELTDVELEVQQDDVLRNQVAVLQQRLQGQQATLRSLADETSATSGQKPPSKPQPLATSRSALEDKLIRLEKLVGESSSTKTSLMDRLSQLEVKLEVLDESKLEAASRKAKVLRQDLEAASKARNKLMAPNRAEDSKTITSLYDSMLELQEMSQHLPALAQRLQTLSHQHVDAATWTNRLQAVEAASTRLNAQLASVETAVSNVEDVWKENADMLRNNLKSLEDRFQVTLK